jgi:hypothetical protein
MLLESGVLDVDGRCGEGLIVIDDPVAQPKNVHVASPVGMTGT